MALPLTLTAICVSLGASGLSCLGEDGALDSAGFAVDRSGCFGEFVFILVLFVIVEFVLVCEIDEQEARNSEIHNIVIIKKMKFSF